MASAAHETDEQKLQKDLEELEKIIAFGSSSAQLLNTVTVEKRLPDASSATEHIPSTPVKSSISTTDHKDNKIDTSETVLQMVCPKDHKTTDINKTVSIPQLATKALQPSKVDFCDMIGDFTYKHIVDVNLPSKKRKPGNAKEDMALIDCNMLSKSQQDHKEGDCKENILSGTPPSKSPVTKAPASGPPQKQAAHPPPIPSHPPTNASKVPRHPVPEKPVSKIPAKEPAPPSAPRDYMRNNWELQHYRPSSNRAPVDNIREPRGSSSTSTSTSNRLPNPAFHWPSLPPDLSSNYRPRDPDVELEKLAAKDRDLKDWLVFTGWHDQEYHADFLQRNRRLADLDRERNDIEQERAQLMSADQRAPPKTARFIGSIPGSSADEFKADYASHNTGRELFGIPTPRNTRKREYMSDCEDEAPRKMSRVNNGGYRRDSSTGAMDDYGKRDYYHREEIGEGAARRGYHPRRPDTPPGYHGGYRSQRSPERGSQHSNLENDVVLPHRGPGSKSSAGYRDDEPGPFSSARLQNTRNPVTRGPWRGRGGRRGYRPYRGGT